MQLITLYKYALVHKHIDSSASKTWQFKSDLHVLCINKQLRLQINV